MYHNSIKIFEERDTGCLIYRVVLFLNLVYVYPLNALLLFNIKIFRNNLNNVIYLNYFVETLLIGSINQSMIGQDMGPNNPVYFFRRAVMGYGFRLDR